MIYKLKKFYSRYQKKMLTNGIAKVEDASSTVEEIFIILENIFEI